MECDFPGTDARATAQEVLGYPNFSAGTPDPRFLANVNRWFEVIERCRQQGAEDEPPWQVMGSTLRTELQALHGSSDAFRQVDQADAVLRLAFEAVLPAYRRHHRDLLFHQTEESLCQPLFVGRVCEAVLQQGGPWDQSKRIVAGTLGKLNDFLGHRPVAVLQTRQKIQPYAHEWVAAIPLYIRAAGVAAGRYQPLIQRALAIIDETDPQLLCQAYFEPELLDELALDPRAYDFDHPVNRRPNYLFGQWDMNRLDNSGRCRRFVLQQVSLDAMLQRVEDRGELPYEEVLVEAAAVLAGTILMGSGVSGNRPDAHDSTATLATLVQHIAIYRDEFYERLLDGMSDAHAERLRAEARTLQQPFGGARQHFNQHLARRRTEQLQHVHLGQLFAQMGYTEAAARQVRVVPVASARMRCDLHCRMSSAELEIDSGQLERAASLLPEIEDLLHRAIECGALVDPWNILGFSAQYSLFPALENSIHDDRVDELIDFVGRILEIHVLIQKEAAAAGNPELQDAVAHRLDRFAGWWDQFASTEVSSVEGISGLQTKQSAEHVATALRARREAGTAAGDVVFWQGHVERFRSPKAYALVVEALLQQHDLVAAMALLIQWLSQSPHVALSEETYSYHDLALQWMEALWETDRPADEEPDEQEEPANQRTQPQPRWPLARKFLDYLEANAEENWEVPRFELAGETTEAPAGHEDQDDEDNPFSAAYEGVTYRDSSDDGFDGEMLDGLTDVTDFELVGEAERLIGRLTFLTTLAQLRKLAAVASADSDAGHEQRDDVLAGWLQHEAANRRGLSELLDAVERYRIPAPRGTHETLIEYDRRRGIKEMLLEQIIATCVETADAARMIRAAMDREQSLTGLDEWEDSTGRVLRAVLRSDLAAVDEGWDDMIEALLREPLLYVALTHGGSPQRIVASRGMQRTLYRLLACLPRFGLVRKTCRLIETIQQMESDHPVGPGAVTEFDQMFQVGWKAIVRCLVVSSKDWSTAESDASHGSSDTELIDLLEQATEAVLRCWLVHSRGVRLSVLETVHDQKRWNRLKQFVQRYGADLFTQRFMNMGNLRAILLQGPDAYLASLEEDPQPENEFLLLDDLADPGAPPSRNDAVHWLGVILEAIVENYSEYVDYNSTTTQSDRGEMLYTLLDYLRLRASYDRVAWNLQPVMLAHDVLVRCGRDEAAAVWRKAVARRTASIAADHLKRLARLNNKYGMRLPSVAERLGERFVRPLAIDRLRALIRPAIEELRDGVAPSAFERLEKEIAPFTSELSGSGFEVPRWLESLQQEVDKAQSPDDDKGESLDPYLRVPQVRLSRKDAQREVDSMTGESA